MSDPLAEPSARLVGELERALPQWVEATVARVSGRDDIDTAATARAVADEVIPKLRAHLALDIDEQRTNPLAVLRGAVPHLTRLLQQHGVEPPTRDEFAVRIFPEDLYDLAPATFVDFGEPVHEAGIEWGAAKAYVHLQRRRAR